MKILILILTLGVLAGGGYVFMQSSQLGQAPLGTLLSSDSQDVVKQAQSFLEDIKYKDFKAAEQYSLPEQRDKFDIPHLIERLFQIKPEFLDVQNYKVLATDFDSSGDRARVTMQADVKLLNSDKIKHPEMILYFKKKDEKWFMDLASSLK